MKISPYNIDDFIRRIDRKTIKGMLIYGPDTGLVSIRKKNILEKLLLDYKNNASLICITPEMFNENKRIICNEYNSNSLFSLDKKVILIEEYNSYMLDSLIEIFESGKEINNDNFILITAEDLESKNSLRKFAEDKDKLNFASIACYPDDKNTIIRIITSKFKENNFRCDFNIVQHLADNFGGDRNIILNELDKLMIYKGNNKTITIEDIKKCIQDNSEADFNDFVNSLASLDFENANKELNKLYSMGENPIGILRTSISYFIKLQLYKYQIQLGLTYEEIASKERIFWLQKPITAKHLKTLSLDDINFILKVLLKEECKLKGKVEFED